MQHNVVVFADGDDRDIFSGYVSERHKEVGNHWRACCDLLDKEAEANGLPFFQRRAAIKKLRKQYARVPKYRTRLSGIVGLLPQEKEGFFEYWLAYDPYYWQAVKADEELKKLGSVSVPYYMWRYLREKAKYGCSCKACVGEV